MGHNDHKLRSGDELCNELPSSAETAIRNRAEKGLIGRKMLLRRGQSVSYTGHRGPEAGPVGPGAGARWLRPALRCTAILLASLLSIMKIRRLAMMLLALSMAFLFHPDKALASAPKTPTITWATPAAITYGTALSATQL